MADDKDSFTATRTVNSKLPVIWHGTLSESDIGPDDHCYHSSCGDPVRLPAARLRVMRDREDRSADQARIHEVTPEGVVRNKHVRLYVF